jgi:enamidase
MTTSPPIYRAEGDGTGRDGSPASIFRNFVVPAIFLVGIPFPLYLLIQYKTGEWVDVLLMLLVWALCVLIYWLPVGIVLFRWKGHWAGRFLIGYLASLPFYFLTVAIGLWLLTQTFLPANLTFHPRTPAQWLAYSYATPTFYLMVFIFFLLVRRGRELARITRAVAVGAFCLALVATVVLDLKTDRYRWPASTMARADIVNAKIVDPSGNQIIEGQDVEIENGKIVEIIPAALDTGGWPKIDAQGGYLLPGMIDVHTHLLAPIRSMQAAQIGFDFNYFLNSLLGDYAPQRREYLEDGVTAVRDVGGPATHIFALRAAGAIHKLLGPRIFAVGRLVTSPHGHPVATIWTREVSRQGAIIATYPASLVAGLERNYADGPPDAVKIIYGTIGMTPEKISKDLLDRAVAWAKSKSLISVVHIETTQEATDAVDAGATGIEHAATMESVPDSLVADMLAHHTFADPTFGEYRTALSLRHVSSADIERSVTQKYEFMRQLDAAGVALTIGTDAPLVAYGEGYQDELGQFAKAGFTPGRILTFATLNNAAYLGKANELGKIAPNYDADMFLIRANPLVDIAAVRNPIWVMLSGQIVVRRADDGRAGRASPPLPSR